jgi:tetratricopeptide (TPR) repeat protein
MRKVLAVMCMVMLSVSCLAASTFAEDELFDTKAATEHMEKGIKLLAAKNYDGAIEELEEAVATAPSAESYYALGYAYYMKGKSGDEESRQMAVENFEQAYDLDPNFSPNKIGTPEVMEAPPSGQGEMESPAAAAPANKLEPGAAAPAQEPAPAPAPAPDPAQ